MSREYERIKRCHAYVRTVTDFVPKVGLILGSGLGGYAKNMEVVCEIPYGDIPDFPVSTPELFARIDGMRVRCRPDTAGLLAALAAGDLPGVARRMYNVFEKVLPERQEVRVAEIKHTLIQCGALGATMSGTGPTAFGLFQRKELAEEACALLSEQNRDTFLAETV